MNENFASLSLDRKVQQDILVDPVVIVEIVGTQLIKPDRLAGIGIARENPGRKFIVAGTSFGIPRARIRGAVIDQVQLRIVRDPSPNARSTDFPGIWRPSLDAEILAAVLRIERFEFRSDQNVFIGPRAVSPPCDSPSFFIESRKPAANAEFPATVAN